MTKGRLIAVVGPSGVGKDSLMTALSDAAPEFCLARRSCTRAPDLGGEDYRALSPDAFARAVDQGAFCVHWQAHGLQYGIPSQVLTDVRDGRTCLANFSRKALKDAATVFPSMTVLSVTARPDTLTARLVARGRENAADIAKRLARSAAPLPEGLHVVTISNDGPLAQTVSDALAALHPVRA